MNIDYESLDADIDSGLFRNRLEEELTFGFRQLHNSGERLPPASYLAAQIAEIVNRDIELSSEVKYNLYQEILAAVENARVAVLGEEKPVS
ncbi:MAG TPA: hypothetical protein VF883_13470 [Thermoanaerobaculia bacterium]|jgi:hypothetical protein